MSRATYDECRYFATFEAAFFNAGKGGADLRVGRLGFTLRSRRPGQGGGNFAFGRRVAISPAAVNGAENQLKHPPPAALKYLNSSLEFGQRRHFEHRASRGGGGAH